jgi:hypothetical protein
MQKLEEHTSLYSLGKMQNFLAKHSHNMDENYTMVNTIHKAHSNQDQNLLQIRHPSLRMLFDPSRNNLPTKE